MTSTRLPTGRTPESSLTNGRGSWVVGRGYKSWVVSVGVGVGVGVGVCVSNITN